MLHAKKNKAGERETMEEAAAIGEDQNGVPPVVSILSALLQRVADRNDALAACHDKALLLSAPRTALAFCGFEKPEISIRCYLERIFRFANCSLSCYVVAFIYLDRFLYLHPSLSINSFNVHRFLITSILISIKFMEDRYYNNAYFARVGGISLTEMNYLEVDFLFGLRFDLNMTPIIFTSYCSMLQREMNLANPQIPPNLHCFLSEDESSNSCQQKQLIV